MKVWFQNDNNTEIILPEHPKSHTFATRDSHEVMFRRISTWLINNKFITRNIIDTGAWIGDNSVPWAKNISGTVYAIDPSKNNCIFMEQVQKLNDIQNLVIIEKALSDKEEDLATDHHIDHCAFHVGTNGITRMTATTLDILHTQGVIKDIDFIHLDVEGMELKVINGMERVIDAYHPIIAFEQHLELDDIAQIINKIKSKKYFVHMINEILPGCRPDCRNFIAFPDTEKFEEAIKQLRRHIGTSDLFTRF
jgi:FkbM family methyltransferase